MSKDPGSRALAARTVDGVLHKGRSLESALEAVFERVSGDAPRGAVLALSYGTLRFVHRLNPVLDQLLHRPLPRKESVIRCLALVGLFDLSYEDTPAHAAVNEAGEAARQLKRPWAVKLINALLRGYQRRESELLAAVDRNPAQRHSHPNWLLKAIRESWPEQWQAICDANNRRPPMWLRVNLARTNRASYIDQLTAAGIAASAGEFCETAVLCHEPKPVADIPGFDEGLVSVQDGAAQLVGRWLDLAPGQRVLDACAAPGGKTAMILEACPDVEVTAVDVDEQRLARVADTLKRTGTQARLLAADAAASDQWWDGQPFDRILIDAPCTGTGVIRRHPDIKSLRRVEDLTSLSQQQLRLLEGLWPLLAPTGRMVYTTCSIMPQENEHTLQKFASSRSDVAMIAAPDCPGVARALGWQLLPGTENLDGFYFAAMQRRP